MTKPTKWSLRPVKTQISLGICPLWSVFAVLMKKHLVLSYPRSVPVAKRLVLPTSDHGVAGSNPAGGEILPEPKRRFIAQSLSCSPLHRLKMTEILLKGRKTLTHPSILSYPLSAQWRLWLDWADAQADLSLHWAHIPFWWFCHEAAQILMII